MKDEPLWEQRRYWQDGTIVHVEWRCGHLCDSVVAPGNVLQRDYCYQHRTQIYPDLGCQVCRQRPRKRRTPHPHP